MKHWGILLLFGLGQAVIPAHAAEDFPIGIFGVDSIDSLAQLKQDGFNTVQTYRRDPAFLESFIKEAHRCGLRVVVNPASWQAAGKPPAAWERTVRAWYLADEPEITGQSPETITARRRWVQAGSADVPTALTVGAGLSAAPYRDAADILMLDWYPVPHRPLESVGTELDQAVQGVSGKPVWMIVQAFDWRDFPQHRPDSARIGRFPSFDEIRFMSYDSIVHGARGLFFYTLAMPGGLTLQQFPAEYQALRRVVAELRDLLPVFEQGTPIAIPFPLPSSLEAWAARRGMLDYVVLANRSDHAIAMPEVILNRAWRPLFEVRRDAGDLSWPSSQRILEPYQVLVLEKREGRMPSVMLLVFLAALIGSLCLTPVARRAAWRLGILDHPGPLKLQRQPIAYLGGAGLLGGMLLGLLAAARMIPDFPVSWVALLVLGSFAMAVLGLMDDVRNIPPVWRLIGEFAVGVGLLRSVGHLNWPAAVILGSLVPIAANAVNLTDGQDGLAGSLAAVFGLGSGLLGLVRGDLVTAALGWILAGACLGFLKYNWHPAEIMMGDCGSLLLGFWIAAMAAWQLHRSPTALDALQVGLLLAFPLIDMTLAFIRRLIRGRGLFQGDRDHLYDVLTRSGLQISASTGLCMAFALLMVWVSWSLERF